MTLPKLVIYAVSLALGQCWISASLALDTTGSLIKFPDNVREFKDVDEKAVCIPAGTIVKVVNGTSSEKVKVTILKEGTSSQCKPPAHDEHTEYTIASTDLAKHEYIRKGLSYGTLVVPFKFQLHDRSLQQGATLGGYLGKQLPFGGFNSTYNFTMTPLIFAGGSWANVPQTQPNGSATNSNQLGISFGAGTFFTINNSYQLGVILGWDRLGSNASPAYKYEGKPWLSFAIGWNFAQ